MSLPTITSLVDCVDYSKTVSPYLPQLYDLPQQVFQTITNPQGLKELYLSTNPLVSAIAISLFLSPIFLVAAEVNRNYSQVDRFWSLLPTFYNAHYALYAHATGLPTQRLDAVLAFSTLWSVSCVSLSSSYISKSKVDAVDLQLLAKRWVQHWFRGLSLGYS